MDDKDIPGLLNKIMENCDLHILGQVADGNARWQFFRFVGKTQKSLADVLIDFVVWAVKMLVAAYWEHHKIYEYIKCEAKNEPSAFKALVVAYLEADPYWRYKE